MEKIAHHSKIKKKKKKYTQDKMHITTIHILPSLVLGFQ